MKTGAKTKAEQPCEPLITIDELRKICGERAEAYPEEAKTLRYVLYEAKKVAMDR